MFALTFGLLISDYMARQVLNAVFPLLKAEWGLTDGQLGFLSGVVALMVGLLTIPISLLADRLGRVKSIAAMAMLWSVATLLCGLARNYEQMLAARVLVGVGEAAYGSVGIAVIISVFPRHMRATLTGAFMAGGLAGQILGVGIGGLVAAAHGWRMAFLAIGAGGLLLALAYPLFVRESRLNAGEKPEKGVVTLGSLRSLFAGTQLQCAYVGSGLSLLAAAALPAWLPTFFFRYYDLPLDEAAPLAALFLAIGGAGMIVCGMISDKFVRSSSQRALLSVGYCLGLRVADHAGDEARRWHAAARSPRRGNVPCRRLRWTGRRDGREPDACRATRHGIRRPNACKQRVRAGARTDPHRLAGRSHWAAGRDAVASLREPCCRRSLPDRCTQHIG